MNKVVYILLLLSLNSCLEQKTPKAFIDLNKHIVYVDNKDYYIELYSFDFTNDSKDSCNSINNFQYNKPIIYLDSITSDLCPNYFFDSNLRGKTISIYLIVKDYAGKHIIMYYVYTNIENLKPSPVEIREKRE